MTNAELVKEIKQIAGVTGEWDDNYDFEYPPNAPDDDAEEIFVLVEDDDWTQEHKYQDRSQIWYYPARGVHFMVSESRSGSYHTDWYYNPPEVDIVTRHEKWLLALKLNGVLNMILNQHHAKQQRLKTMVCGSMGNCRARGRCYS